MPDFNLVMHILEIPSFFPPYGGLFCLDQAKALAALGHEVRILSNVQLGMTIGMHDYLTLPYGRYEHVEDGITVCQSYQRGVPRLIRYNVHRWVSIVCSMFADYSSKYGKPDVLHAHCCKWAGYAAMLIGKEYDILYVITEHLSKLLLQEELGDPSTVEGTSWQVPLLRQAYENANMVIPVSEELVDSLACYFGKDYRYQALSNVIDVEFYHCRARQPRIGRPFRFCCLANYWPLKGYDVLFAAFRLLRQQGLNVELHIAGKGTDSAKCRSQIAEGVTSHGLLDKEGVRRLLYESDALVLASRSEVQPLVLLEAMSTGIPVVATDCVPRSLRIEEGCIIVPIGDADALASAMSEITDKIIDGRQLSEQVAKIASPEVVGRKLEKIFSEIVSSK